jgi:hypothetical protein
MIWDWGILISGVAWLTLYIFAPAATAHGVPGYALTLWLAGMFLAIRLVYTFVGLDCMVNFFPEGKRW